MEKLKKQRWLCNSQSIKFASDKIGTKQKIENFATSRFFSEICYFLEAGDRYQGNSSLFQ